MTRQNDQKPETLAARGNGFLCADTGAITPPIHPSSTFARDENYERIGQGGYSRDDNPTYTVAEALLSKLEGGAGAKLFASGMAATCAVFQALAPRRSRGRFGDDVFWHPEMAARMGRALGSRGGVCRYDRWRGAGGGGQARCHTPGLYRDAGQPPVGSVTDIRAAADIAHGAGAVLAVDNTAASPVLTRPIEHGADLVVHSATKYLNGHSDVVAGAIVTAREDDLWERIGQLRYLAGAILGPFEAWLLLRGMRTLFVRVRQSSQSAMAIARHFDGHPKIAQVCYPGLESFPGHDIAARQMTGGFSGMLSLRVAGGGEAALNLAKRCKLFIRATSLGGVESLIEHRATIEGDDSDTPEDLLRLSIGLEQVGDLIADLEQALG